MAETKRKGLSGAARTRRAALLIMALCALAGGGWLLLKENDVGKRKIAELSETETLALIWNGIAYLTDIGFVGEQKI